MPKLPVRRASVKQESILADLRQRITSGRLRPGLRLPTHRELSRTLGVSNVTVARALGQLEFEGFIEARGRQGTFVADRPPHLNRYALLFPATASEPVWGYARFWRAMLDAAERYGAEHQVQLLAYKGIAPRGDATELQRLQEDLAAHQLGGLILMAPSVVDAKITLTQVPVVAVTFQHPTVPWRVKLGTGQSQDQWIDKALERLAARGRSRVAVLCSEMQASPFMEQVTLAVKRRGMTTRPHWMQSVGPWHAEWARNSTRLLVDRPAEERPDALLVTDDTLVEHGVGGLVDAGIRVPEDIDVVAHCNFPWPPPSVLPIHRLGYDVREVLNGCLTLIERQRITPKAREKVIEIPAMFEQEIPEA